MPRSTWLLAALFALSVFPTTGIALLFAMVGLPLWLAGVGDLLRDTASVGTARLDMALLFVTGPFGLIGVCCLWRVFWLLFRRRVIVKPGRLALGLLAGLLAGTHLLFLKVALLGLALPATIFSLLQLRAAHRNRALSGAP